MNEALAPVAAPPWVRRALDAGFACAGALDALRLVVLRSAKGWVRPFIRDRELRVALVGMLVVGAAAATALWLPLWSLALGPLVLGVPHLLADVRYLVARPGHHRRRPLWWAAGLPLLLCGVGGGVAFGLLAAVGAVLVLGTDTRRRAAALLCVGALGVALALVPGANADLVFAHAHNFLAVALWWAWRRRRGWLHLLPVLLFAVVSVAILTGAASAVVAWSASIGGVTWPAQLAALAPGTSPELGVRLVVLFAFAQSVHYGIWLRLVPEEDRDRATPRTFTASLRALERDVGAPTLVAFALVAAGLVAWALVDLAAARDGYFRLATFHGSLELCALAALIAGGGGLRTRS
jgi:hypothetical protein